MTEIEIVKAAINNLVPNALCNIAGTLYSDIEWTDKRKMFTEDQFNDAVNNVKSSYESIKQLRSTEYPSVEDQLDMLWHSMNAGFINNQNPFYEAIKAVKSKYPKPE
jgi:hypothetical protein